MGKKPLRIHIIACKVMEPELRQLKTPRVGFTFLEQGLHRTPGKMPVEIQKRVDMAQKYSADFVVLGYGLCSNGIVGVKAKKQVLIVPKIHDCISLFLGSPEAYDWQSKKTPGTYYLTRGWIEQGKTPLSIYEEYVKRYEAGTADWLIREELKHYTRIALVDTGVGDVEGYRDYARRTADFLGFHYEEIKGSSAFFQKMVSGHWDGDFLKIRRGEEIIQKMFFDKNRDKKAEKRHGNQARFRAVHDSPSVPRTR